MLLESNCLEKYFSSISMHADTDTTRGGQLHSDLAAELSNSIHVGTGFAGMKDSILKVTIESCFIVLESS